MPLRLLQGIRHFKNHAFAEEKDLFASLSKGQAPDVLFITCSDSRIIPTQFTHTNLGDLFVIRNAGNIIAPHSEQASGEEATIEFALNQLHIREIIVCGHSHCGAMKGLKTENLAASLPVTARWLQHSRPALEQLYTRHPELLEDSTNELLCLTQDNILL